MCLVVNPVRKSFYLLSGRLTGISNPIFVEKGIAIILAASVGLSNGVNPAPVGWYVPAGNIQSSAPWLVGHAQGIGANDRIDHEIRGCFKR